MRKNLLIAIFGIFLFAQIASSQAPIAPSSKGVVLTALQEELQRAQKILKQKGDPAPYLISYQVTETSQTIITAQYGALQNTDSYRVRLLDVDVRVGEYQLDNTHRGGGGGGGYAGGGGGAIPISNEDDLDAIKSSLWMATDQKYRAAQERLIQIKTDHTFCMCFNSYNDVSFSFIIFLIQCTKLCIYLCKIFLSFLFFER